jgi:acyl-coenzyme A thioesterase PaaI-like protein
MRRLNRAVAGFAPDDDVLRSVARAADELARRLETAPQRLKLDDMDELTALAADQGGWQRGAPIGERIEFDPLSPCGGRLHPSSIGLDMHRDSETSVLARVTIDPMFQGPPGRVHGGVVAMIVDEVMGTVNTVLDQRAFTARLTINLRAPAPIGTPLTFRAWLHEVRARKITILAEGHSDDGLFVEADGLFVATRTEGDEPAAG